MTGMFSGAVDWPTVRGLVVQAGRHRLQHIAPELRADLAREAAAHGLALYVVTRTVLELRLAERRGAGVGPRLPRGRR